MDQLLEKVATSQVIFIGESHDRYDHHLNQLAIIKSKHESEDQLAIGLEFIQQPFQSTLDDYIAGNIDEAALLEGTHYFDRWGYDFRLYRPIFSYAREHGIPLIALNIDREITDRVKAEGIQSLSEEQRRQLPAEINRDDAAYRERLKEIYLQHPHADEDQFESFMEIQLLWDESMAERSAAWIKQNPEGHMIILAGSGHIIYGSGIPDRVKRRTSVTTTSIINGSGEAPLNRDIADFVIITEEQKLPPSGKLGVILDSTQSPPNITGFVEGSGAKQAGIRKDDQIIRIDDKVISSYFDIRVALMDKAVAETVKVEVTREGLVFGSENLSYEVKLK